MTRRLLRQLDAEHGRQLSHVKATMSWYRLQEKPEQHLPLEGNLFVLPSFRNDSREVFTQKGLLVNTVSGKRSRGYDRGEKFVESPSVEATMMETYLKHYYVDDDRRVRDDADANERP